MRLPRSLAGKVVVVTGAARGIGAALAEALAAKGARVALVGLEADQLAAVAERCGPNAAWWECDVTDEQQLAAVVTGVRERFSGVDVLVANAGIAVGGPLLGADPESFDRVIEVNLLGSVRTVRAFLPLLAAGRGYYLQIASLAAIAPAPMMSAYAASKAGVEAFAVALRTEVAHHGVDVGVAYLSFTDTDMTRAGQQATAGGSGSGGLRIRLHPLDAAIERIVAGIERREPFVYGQSFIRWVRPWRWLLPSLTYLGGRRIAVRLERRMAEQGPAGSLPVGAGGQADIAARAARPRRPG